MSKITEKDLKTLPLEQLEEMLQRQNAIACRSCVMSKLIDKGESVRKMRTALIKEIEKRKAESQLTDQLSQINIGDHVKYVCEKETIKPDSKFKPFATLTHTERSSKMKESQKREVSAALEPSYTKEMTKLIPLAESLALQAEQVNRLKEEELKKYVREVKDVIEGTEEEPPLESGLEDQVLDDP